MLFFTRCTFLQNHEKKVDNQGNPKFGLDSILAVSIKLLHPKILLYHIEEDFPFPAPPVNRSVFQSVQLKSKAVYQGQQLR